MPPVPDTRVDTYCLFVFTLADIYVSLAVDIFISRYHIKWISSGYLCLTLTLDQGNLISAGIFFLSFLRDLGGSNLVDVIRDPRTVSFLSQSLNVVIQKAGGQCNLSFHHPAAM